MTALEQEELLSRLADGSFWIEPKLFEAYTEYYSRLDKSSRKVSTPKDLAGILDKKITWITNWSSVHNVKFGLAGKHFLLSAGALQTFSQGLIDEAETEVLIINPLIAKSSISDKLIQAAKRKIKVRVITRKPTDDARGEYHEQLSSIGVKISYNPQIHANVVIVDSAIAIVSSMYFYGATKSLEAGIVTFDPPVVNQVCKFYSRLGKKKRKK